MPALCAMLRVSRKRDIPPVRLSCSAPSAICVAMPIGMRAQSSDNGSSRGIKRNRHRKSLSLLWRQRGSRKTQVLGAPTSQKPKLWAIHPFRKGMEPPTGMAPPTSEPRRMGLLAPICLPHYVVHRVGATPRLLRTAPTEACLKPLVFRPDGVSHPVVSWSNVLRLLDGRKNIGIRLSLSLWQLGVPQLFAKGVGYASVTGNQSSESLRSL